MLEQLCQQTQRTKTEILREMIRRLAHDSSPPIAPNTSASLEEREEAAEGATGFTSTVTVQAVQISARNLLKAKVKRIVKGTVNAEVTLAVAPGLELVSNITRTSADQLRLMKGKEVFAVIKASSVMIATE